MIHPDSEKIGRAPESRNHKDLGREHKERTAA